MSAKSIFGLDIFLFGYQNLCECYLSAGAKLHFLHDRMDGVVL